MLTPYCIFPDCITTAYNSVNQCHQVSLCPRCCTPAGSLAASGCAVCVATWAAHSSLVTAGHPSAALLFRSLILTGFSDTYVFSPSSIDAYRPIFYTSFNYFFFFSL